MQYLFVFFFKLDYYILTKWLIVVIIILLLN